jgi:two-component system cell cycle response regulator
VKILIADDDVTSRLVLAGVLKKHGHEVVATADGAAALDAMLGSDTPRLAVLDWMMPGLSGLEVCRRLRTLASDQPPYIILLTSRGEKSDVIAGLEAGADDYLAKPFDPGELRARVEVGRRVVELQARLIEARDALVHEATHDPLTGVLNRRAFAENLAHHLSGERRYHHGLAVGICDIDEFKKVNDTHGHAVGDDVLCGLVHRIARNLRGHDVLGRHGGDEFVVLTEHAHDEEAGILYERVRAAVADSPFPTRSGDVSVTISFGVKIRSSDEGEDQLFAEADTALYGAKNAGRNQVCLAGRPAPTGHAGPPPHDNRDEESL